MSHTAARVRRSRTTLRAMPKHDRWGKPETIRCDLCNGTGANPDPQGIPRCPKCDGAGWVPNR